MGLPTPTFIGQQATVDGKTYQAESVNPPVWGGISNGNKEVRLRFAEKSAAHMTLAEAQADGTLIVGQYVRLTDYANALYQVVDAGDVGGFYKTGLLEGLRLRLQHKGTIRVEKLGLVPNDASALETNASLIVQARAAGVKEFLYPPEKYYISEIELAHTGSYYRLDTGETHQGVVGRTTFSRGEDQASDVLNYADEDLFREQCLFRVYGSRHKISGIQFEDCAGAIFLGQDPTRKPATASPEVSSIAWNTFEQITAKNCGTGIIVGVTDAGVYFNSFVDIHLTQCQVGLHTKAGEHFTLSVANFNRNTFSNFRTSRCYVGELFQAASTNVGTILNEGNTATPTNNRYAYPSNSISTVDLSHGQGVGMALDSFSHPNLLTVVNEACDRYIQDESGLNLWVGGTPRLLENVSSQGATVLLDRDGIIQDNYIVAINNPLPNMPYRAGVRNLLNPSCERSEGYEINRWKIDAGAFSSGEVKVIPVSTDNVGLVNSVAMTKVKIIADCNVSNLGFTKEFSVVIRRNDSRTPVRYYIADEVNFRATGANTGDNTEPFVVTLLLDGKNVNLSITAPSRVFDSCHIFFEEYLGDNRV